MGHTAGRIRHSYKRVASSDQPAALPLLLPSWLQRLLVLGRLTLHALGRRTLAYNAGMIPCHMMLEQPQQQRQEVRWEWARGWRRAGIELQEAQHRQQLSVSE